jgi:RNA dependent RNA polymerase
MDIFVRNVPDQSTDKQLHKFLLPRLKALGTDVFNCNKFKNKRLALVTVLDPVLAHRFLAVYGDNAVRSPTPITPKLTYLGQTLYFSAGNRQPDPILLQSLRKEVKDKAKNTHKGRAQAMPTARFERKYPYCSLSCGTWDYEDSKLSFIYHFYDARRGLLMFGKQTLAFVVDPDNQVRSRYRLDFPYNSIQSITLGNFQDPSLTCTLSEAPRIFEITESDQTLQALVNRLHIGSRTRTVPKRNRISSLGPTHDNAVSSCFVYRILLSEPSSLRHIESLLKQGQKLPPSISCPTSIMQAKIPFRHEIRALLLALAHPSQPLSFGAKFQMQRLAQNGYLAPARVLELLPEVTQISLRSGSAICIEAVRKLFRQIPYAGPDADPNAFDLVRLLELLQDNEKTAKANGCPLFDLTQQHSHLALIHKATVTPTGVFLEGPEPETKNRVLRKYALHTDFFLRVSFLDEDEVPLRFDRHVSLDEIYHKRFKGVLSAFIEIAGRKFEFLGFSHSSLREQTCWFMAPFIHNSAQLNARGVIARLGDFTSIRSPAKCAARIGQAFSETNGTVKLTPGAVQVVQDIERNGRVFSDGVGTFSYEILRKVWRDYAFGRARPTLLQIRWAGT